MIATPAEGDTVHFLVKGISAKGAVLKVLLPRVHVEREAGGTCWIDMKDIIAPEGTQAGAAKLEVTPEDVAQTKQQYASFHPFEKRTFPQHLLSGIVLASTGQGGTGSGGGMVWETHVAVYDPGDGLVTCLSFNGNESIGSSSDALRWLTTATVAPSSVPRQAPRTRLDWGYISNAGNRILPWAAAAAAAAAAVKEARLAAEAKAVEEAAAAKAAERQAERAAYKQQLSEALCKAKPEWEARVGTLSTQFPALQQETLVAVLNVTEGHVGQARLALKEFSADGDERSALDALLSKLELAKQPPEKHAPGRKLEELQVQVTVEGGQAPGLEFENNTGCVLTGAWLRGATREGRQETGVFVKSVTPGGPAAKAGVAEGWFLQEVAGEKVKHTDKLVIVLKRVKQGEKHDFILKKASITEEDDYHSD